MSQLREGSFISEFFTGLAIAAVACGAVGLFVLFWLPLISYSLHFWIDP